MKEMNNRRDSVLRLSPESLTRHTQSRYSFCQNIPKIPAGIPSATGIRAGWEAITDLDRRLRGQAASQRPKSFTRPLAERMAPAGPGNAKTLSLGFHHFYPGWLTRLADGWVPPAAFQVNLNSN
jgi:hypothetical protein